MYSPLAGSARIGAAPLTMIVSTLRAVPRKSVPVDYLAGLLGQSREEIDASLVDLEARGIVVRGSHDKVALVEDQGNRSTVSLSE